MLCSTIIKMLQEDAASWNFGCCELSRLYLIQPPHSTSALIHHGVLRDSNSYFCINIETWLIMWMPKWIYVSSKSRHYVEIYTEPTHLHSESREFWIVTFLNGVSWRLRAFHVKRAPTYQSKLRASCCSTLRMLLSPGCEWHGGIKWESLPRHLPGLWRRSVGSHLGHSVPWTPPCASYNIAVYTEDTGTGSKCLSHTHTVVSSVTVLWRSRQRSTAHTYTHIHTHTRRNDGCVFTWYSS